MVMTGEVVATQCGNRLKLMVGNVGENSSRSVQRIVERIAGIAHLVATHHSPQTTRIELSIVGHERQTFYERLYFAPNVRK